MPPGPTAESGAYRPYTKTPGTKPLPGYVLLEPLGRGGFGEVWKCEAPGGLHKAVKFVAGDPDSDDGGGDQLRQEFDAFQQIKAIRHPFLLTLERAALIGAELITGGVPDTGKTAAQRMRQHRRAPPDLPALRDCDKPAVARALSKNPDDRYPSCLDFVGALVASTPAEPGRAARPRPTRPQPPA